MRWSYLSEKTVSEKILLGLTPGVGDWIVHFLTSDHSSLVGSSDLRTRGRTSSSDSDVERASLGIYSFISDGYFVWRRRSSGEKLAGINLCG
jgi:hypothetical protein